MEREPEREREIENVMIIIFNNLVVVAFISFILKIVHRSHNKGKKGQWMAIDKSCQKKPTKWYSIFGCCCVLFIVCTISGMQHNWPLQNHASNKINGKCRSKRVSCLSCHRWTCAENTMLYTKTICQRDSLWMAHHMWALCPGHFFLFESLTNHVDDG